MGKPLHLTIQSDVFVILGVTILLCLAVIALSKKIDKTDPLAKPHGAGPAGDHAGGNA